MSISKVPDFGKLLKVDAFTSSGSWTCPSGVYAVEVVVVGAGGGGGGGIATGGRCGGSGGGGQVIRRMVTVTPGTSYTVTVGAGGAGGAGSSGSVATTGSVGGDSSFDTITALGGGAGAGHGATATGRATGGGGPGAAVNGSNGGPGGGARGNAGLVTSWSTAGSISYGSSTQGVATSVTRGAGTEEGYGLGGRNDLTTIPANTGHGGAGNCGDAAGYAGSDGLVQVIYWE